MKYVFLIILTYCSYFFSKNETRIGVNKFHQEQTDTLTVFGNCKMCKRRIEGSILGYVGVTATEWNIETKILTITYHPFENSLEEIQKIIIESGHDTRRYTAQDSIYNQLPVCCKYRKNKLNEK